MKKHYTIYNGNYDRGEATYPICNDKKRIPHAYLTRKHEEITCKNCLKSLKATLETVIEMRKMRREDTKKSRIELDKINMMINLNDKK